MKTIRPGVLAAVMCILCNSTYAQSESEAKLSKADAVSIALKAQMGTIAEAELDEFEGRLAYDIEVLTETGEEVEFKIDAETGAILDRWTDDDPSDDPEPHVEMSIPLDWALTAASAAEETCAEMGFDVTVTVVDQRAQPRVQLMKEGAFPHTVHTSSRKAITAASRREATAVIEAENEHEPSLGAVFNEIGLITLSGGIPILFNGEVIGGIGIAGSPGEDKTGKEFDDICGEAGIAAIADYLE